MRKAMAVCAAMLLGGCASLSGAAAPTPACAIGAPMIETMLFLGMDKPDGAEVSVTEFAHFIEEVVTPRWKEGYTILEAAGLWYSEQRRMTDRESTRILLRLHDGGAAESSDAEAIRAAYIQRFDQDAVLRTDRRTCADF